MRDDTPAPVGRAARGRWWLAGGTPPASSPRPPSLAAPAGQLEAATLLLRCQIEELTRAVSSLAAAVLVGPSDCWQQRLAHHTFFNVPSGTYGHDTEPWHISDQAAPPFLDPLHEFIQALVTPGGPGLGQPPHRLARRRRRRRPRRPASKGAPPSAVIGLQGAWHQSSDLPSPDVARRASSPPPMCQDEAMLYIQNDLPPPPGHDDTKSVQSLLHVPLSPTSQEGRMGEPFVMRHFLLPPPYQEDMFRRRAHHIPIRFVFPLLADPKDRTSQDSSEHHLEYHEAFNDEVECARQIRWAVATMKSLGYEVE